MILISHRGNISGPNPEKENRPSYIDCAIQLGYDVEVDLRFINDEFWLGHDEPQYKIEISWMKLRKNKIWFHCKDKNSAIKLLELNDEYKFFCHSNDSFILTSTGHLWVHDLLGFFNEKCIIPLLSKNEILNNKNTDVFAICTDYIFINE